MTLSGTRGLVRVSVNPGCDLLAAMAIERVREPDFFRQVTGRVYDGEYGERPSARRRGAKFEANLHANDAALLRQAIGPLYGHDPAAMSVRDFTLEVPGPPTSMRAQRLVRCRKIIEDLAAGRPVPDLLVQPQLRLPTGPGRHDFEQVSPDYMVLDRSRGMYVPGEEKSFVIRDNVADPADLDLTRRQAAAQVLALRAETARVGLDSLVSSRAVFVFATPYGLRPAPGREEHVDAEIHAVTRALLVIETVRRLLNGLGSDRPALAMLADELRTNFVDSCLSTCILAPHCATSHAGTSRILGDSAARSLGATTTASDVSRLITATAGSLDAQAEALAIRLLAAAQTLGLSPEQVHRRLA